jgi:katanin p60 ATPase-containing subunit A1
MSLLGNYETSSVYYQGVIQQIHRLLATIDDPGRKQKWQQIQGEVAQEYDVVKNIMQTLALFKGGESHDSRQVGPGLRSLQSFEEPTRDPDVWPAPPPRDMWSTPSPAVAPSNNVVKPVRGSRKDSRTSVQAQGGRKGTASSKKGGAATKEPKGGPGYAGVLNTKSTKGDSTERGRRTRGGGATANDKKDDKAADKDKVCVHT